MTPTTHMARIIGPVGYEASGGTHLTIPLGPCLVEQRDGHLVDIVWGEKGQNTAALPIEALESAEESGHLVLLD